MLKTFNNFISVNIQNHHFLQLQFTFLPRIDVTVLGMQQMAAQKSVQCGQGSNEKYRFSLKKQSQKTSCLKCHKFGDCLVCINWDCPIVVHESCMPSVARFDDSWGFYCPYCFYKQSLVECHQAKEKVLLANKALINFLDTRTRIDAGHPKIFGSLKRKKPDAPSTIKKSDDAALECNEVHQPMQVEGGHQDDSQFLETLYDDQQESMPTRDNCPEKGPPAKNGMLHNDCSLTILKVKLANAGQSHESHDTGDCRIEDKDEIQVKSSESAIFPTREDNVLVTQNSTNELGEIAKTVLGSFNIGVEWEQRQTDPQETPRCLTNNNTLEINENPYNGNHSALQDPCNAETQVLENFDRLGETKEDFNRTQEGCMNTKTDAHLMRKDKESFPPKGLGKTSLKHLKIEQTVEIYHDILLVEKTYTQEELKESSVCCTRVDNAFVINGKPDGVYDSAYHNGDPVLSQRMVNSGNGSQDAGLGKYQCQRTDEDCTSMKSPFKHPYYTKKDNEIHDTVIREDSGNSNKKIEETSKPVEYFYNAQEEKVLTHEESQKDCCETAGEINIQAKAFKDDVYISMDNNAAVAHELGNLASKHSETKDSLEKYRMAEMKQTQTKRRSTRNIGKKDMAEESDAENYSSSHCGMANGGKTRVNSQKNSPQITRNGSLSVSTEEFGSADESSNTDYLGRGIYAVPKRKMQKNLKNDIQHGNFSEISKNEAESRHKVESIKKFQRSIILPVTRRRRLPWTAQEVEMLKEGVQKFALMPNKNIPWIKILEYGRHIFDGTRVPADLKDKWKRIKDEGNANTDV